MPLKAIFSRVEKEFLTSQRVAHIATLDPNSNYPHVVPIACMHKENIVSTYNHYAAFHQLEWRKPTYQRAISIKNARADRMEIPLMV